MSYGYGVHCYITNTLDICHLYHLRLARALLFRDSKCMPTCPSLLAECMGRKFCCKPLEGHFGYFFISMDRHFRCGETALRRRKWNLAVKSSALIRRTWNRQVFFAATQTAWMAVYVELCTTSWEHTGRISTPRAPKQFSSTRRRFLSDNKVGWGLTSRI